MEKNKTGNYLKYAIGEIVLVVIGILIALQINNWNEQRKMRSEEKYLYGKMLKDLSKEVTINKRDIKWSKKYQDINYQIYNETQGAEPLLNLTEYNWIQYIHIYHPVIETNYKDEIALISNDSIKGLLKDYIYYENRTRDAVNEFNDFKTQKLRPFFEVNSIYNTEGAYGTKERYKFSTLESLPMIRYDKLKEQYENKELQGYLFNLRFKTAWLISNLEILLDKNNALKTALVEEIK
jgi:hypothetical protein